LGSSAVLPVSVPRLPIGLGGLAVEAEAVDSAGVQLAGILIGARRIFSTHLLLADALGLRSARLSPSM